MVVFLYLLYHRTSLTWTNFKKLYWHFQYLQPDPTFTSNWCLFLVIAWFNVNTLNTFCDLQPTVALTTVFMPLFLESSPRHTRWPSDPCGSGAKKPFFYLHHLTSNFHLWGGCDHMGERILEIACFGTASAPDSSAIVVRCSKSLLFRTDIKLPVSGPGPVGIGCWCWSSISSFRSVVTHVFSLSAHYCLVYLCLRLCMLRPNLLLCSLWWLCIASTRNLNDYFSRWCTLNMYWSKLLLLRCLYSTYKNSSS